ncbi:MAG: prepilin-type N-terminal cleavage/methylation domain-containing protein [Leptolyngbya sp. RL_3_1]|nr:prepilin-type N-terminal cleavage/methylation domain-containing protein [Leptolyngbya sp. RL_3_1]
MGNRWKSQSGFTLIELMVVVIIIGILAALALPAYTAMVRRARYAEVKLQMGTISKEAQIYLVEHGQYPPDVNGNTPPAGMINWPQEVPFDGRYDYDHWGVGQNQCYVQVGFVGESQQRQYQVHAINAQPSSFQAFDDNLVLGVALYDCASGRGSIR